jgi:hypothetical protein
MRIKQQSQENLRMSGRSNVWLVVAALFFFINFGGGLVAAVQGELLHAGTHAGLLILGAYYVRRVWRRSSAIPDPSRELADSLTRLEHSVAAVAIDVERIGEGQRFITRLFTDKGTARRQDAETPLKDISPNGA